MTSVDRTAYPGFARVVSARELAEAFSPTEAEVEWARGRTQDENHQLALMVWLKAYQRLGYFPKVEDVPAAVVGHVRGALGLGDDVELERAAARSAKRHREFVRKRLGVVYDAPQVRQVAEEAIRRAVQSKDDPADLINVALEELVRQRCELPGYSTLDTMAASIRTEVNTGFFQTVAERLDAGARSRLARLLVVDPVTRRSEFDRLKDVAKAASLSKFKQRLALLADIEAIGPTGVWLQGVPLGKVGHFAGEAHVTDAADMRKVGEDKRLTLLACFVHTAATGVRDDVVTMFCKRIAAIHKRGRDHLEALREAHRAESERLLEVFGDVLSVVQEAASPAGAPTGLGDGTVASDPVPVALPTAQEVAERAGRMVLKTLEQAGGLEALVGAHEAVSAHHGNNYLPLLDQHYRSHRSALFTLVDAIELEATTAERSVLEAVEFLRELRGAKAAFVPEEITVERPGPAGESAQVRLRIEVEAFASGQWRKILRDSSRPGMLVRRHLEVCVFSYLAAELRSGDLAVVGSDSYANLHDQLMSWQECRPLVPAFCAQAGIPATAAALTAHYRDKLAAIAAAVDAGYPANTDLLLEGGRPVLRRRKGAERRPSALALEAAIHDRLPQRALLDILTRTAYLLKWHRHFGPASGSDPKIRDAMARYVLTAFAHGTLLGPAQVAAHMRGLVSVHELSLGNKHANATKVDKASVDVVNAFNKLDVASVWGDGKTVAADGSQIDTWENNLLAETSIRYGGYGGIAYRHISNTYVALFSRFIPCGVWEAVYIIDGLLKNTSDIQPDTIHADTQGQALPVFGLGALLGFDLLPRIRNWHDLIFYRPDAGTRYQHIDSLFGDDTIDWDLIETHWTDLLRTAISIRENKLSSVTLLRRLGNHSRKNRLYRAFRELGRAIRTITLLRYLSEPQLRDQITAVTNRTEAFHGFAGWLMFGGKLIGHNDPDHQEKVVKFNELIANCVIYSNACDITDAANAIAAEGHPVDTDDLATISPYITHTIRRFGNWTLDLTPPGQAPTTRLDLEPRVLFAPST
ncbi:Tn3 family transposase [Actinomadura parmotrematis]|uniref:Tn3 family transposase n=1 Tax=Actinomadura parmotrematis TaxID=2864039 RepID=A0ABS7FQN7_9ACTN|nr:Tn3 family transposase [Actinomadura parmotrematis]MBW8482621.1 Tn3 family transposase [Actinomadura parmotrematis]